MQQCHLRQRERERERERDGGREGEGEGGRDLQIKVIEFHFYLVYTKLLRVGQLQQTNHGHRKQVLKHGIMDPKW